MTERLSFVDDGVPLLCQRCGAPAGLLLSPMDGPPPEQPDPAFVNVRCWECAATEEAEAITEEAANG